MYRSILVPLDGSTFSEQALPLALTIARRSQAVIRLAHVHVDTEMVYAMSGIPIVDDSFEAPARDSERAYLDGLARRLTSRWSLPVTCALLDGATAGTLQEYAVASGVDLVVMSTHGRGAIGHLWYGSVADSLVRQAPMPVMLVRPHPEALDLLDLTHETTLRQILVPLDGSALAEDALAHAVELGELVQAHYTLLQAIDPLVLTHAPSAALAHRDETPLDQCCEEARAYLEQIAAQLRAQSLRVQTAVMLAPPAVAIREYARQHRMDLIAMTTHGRSGISRLLLGSVVDQVVRIVCVPVLLHRPHVAPYKRGASCTT
jgi:nucleotide-binding universal stress UspA family protein